jgi:hypothetical protein
VRPVPADEAFGGQRGAGAESARFRAAEQGTKDRIAVERWRAEPVDAAVGRDQGSRARVSQQPVIRKGGGALGVHVPVHLLSRSEGQLTVRSSPSSEP